MLKKRLLTVIICVGFIWLMSQLGLLHSLNSMFYSRFQSESLNKSNQFSTITIEQNDKKLPSYSEWKDALDKILLWTNKDIYLIDFYAEGEEESFTALTENNRVHFVQSTLIDEDFVIKANPLPENISAKTVYSLNYPNFTNGVISDYQVVNNLHTDIIQYLYKDRQKEQRQGLNINFMLGQSYLPAVNFKDLIDNKIHQRLFNDKSVIIVNQSRRIVPTLLSHSRPITQSQYYAYLFETALQDIEPKNAGPILLLALLLLLGFFILLISYFLPNRIKLPVVIFTSGILLFLSFLILGATAIYLPVIETLLALFVPLYFIQQQDNLYDKEQLSLGTRLYRQILESTGKSQRQKSHSSLLESFSRFLCDLTGIKVVYYEIVDKGQQHSFIYNGTELIEHKKTNRRDFEYNYNLSLLFELKATISIKSLPENFDSKSMGSLLANKEQYIKKLLSQFGLEYIANLRGVFRRQLGRSRYTASHEQFKITTESFLSHYHLLKNHFESLQTASILYGVNGELIQTNQAAEYFIRENEVKLFNQTLIETLVNITDLDEKVIRNTLLSLVDDQEIVVVWPTRKEGFDKSYVVTLSAFSNENVYFGGFLIGLLDVEEVNYVSSLKHNLISELINQLRNDFSEVILAIDFLAMGIEGGLSLEEVSAKVSVFSEKLQSSDLMLQTTNDIMRNKQYPVDIRELVAQSIKDINEVIEAKQITLNIKQPRFINLVLVNYQRFTQICKQLMLFAVKDCMEEEVLSIVINELEYDDARFVSIVIKTKGYGMFDHARVADNALQDLTEITELDNIKEYIISLGGEIELESSIGEGSTISTLLPCYRF